MDLEEIVKFQRKIKDENIPYWASIKDIDFWRNILRKAGLIGRDPGKYGGLGYGNISQRASMLTMPVNKRKFVITGSQTAHISQLKPKNYATVYEYYPEKNLVIEGGMARASSESLTHGAIYDLDQEIGAVVHCHCSHIENRAIRMNIPGTDTGIEAGTPGMAAEVSRLYEKTNLKKIRLFAMGGHEDGFFSFGKNPEEATIRIFQYLSSINFQFSGF